MVKYVCNACADRKCVWCVEGVELSTMELQEATCKVDEEVECYWTEEIAGYGRNTLNNPAFLNIG